MIIWLNGTFGAGKTTTAEELTALVPGSRIFDAEQVGYMLRHVLDSVPVKDFQDWPPWRGLVVQAASQILDFLGGTLVVTQTVLVHPYWTEIRTGLENAGTAVHHFVLHADSATLTERIATDPKPESIKARQWRLDHLPAYEEALPWLTREATVIDTTRIPAARVAEIIAEAAG